MDELSTYDFLAQERRKKKMKKLSMVAGLLIAVVGQSARPLRVVKARVGRAAPLLAQVGPTPTVPIVRWLWNFGDPSTGPDNISTEQNPTHRFSHAKVYSVTLTVWDSNGNSDSVTRYVTVAK